MNDPIVQPIPVRQVRVGLPGDLHDRLRLLAVRRGTTVGAELLTAAVVHLAQAEAGHFR